MDNGFEYISPSRRLMKKILVDPLANYLPAAMLRGLLRFGKSEMAAANWADPGGWRSMVISYEAQCRQIADKVLIGQGVMAMALRNRKKLASELLRKYIENSPVPSHVLCLGAGPGCIIADAMAGTAVPCQATLVDINSDAFAYGRQLAQRHGLEDRMRFVQGDVRDVRSMLQHPPTLVKMIGICEYLADEQILSIIRAVHEVMPSGAPIVFNNLTLRHGNDRFFRRVLGLNMVHRSVEQLSELMRQGGFDDFDVHHEPLGVYSVIAAFRRP